MLKFVDKTSRLEIDSCPECYGLWFDREELKQFFQSPELSLKVLDEGAAKAVLPPIDEVLHQAQERLCPNCEEALFSSTLGKTQVDYCLGCQGIWFDSSELEDMVQAYRAGERGNLLIVNQLAEGLGTPSTPNPRARQFLEALERYRRSVEAS